MGYSLELLEKITQAHRVSARKWIELPVRSIRELVVTRRISSESYLTYINAVGERSEFTYEHFCKKVFGVAQYLLGKRLKTGDRIATIAHNHWQTAVQYFASWLLGIVVVPVNLGEDDERIAYILENAKVKHAFILKEYEQRIRKIIAEHAPLQGMSVTIYSDQLEYAKESDVISSPTERVSLSSEALIVYTSGTTGNPKGVVLSQQNLLEDARAIADWHKISARTRMMCVLPIHHVNGTVVTLMTPFYSGASIVLNQKFSVHHFFERIKQEDVNIVSVVPTLLQYLNHEYQDKEFDGCPSLHHIICGAGPLTVAVAKNFEERFKVRIVHGYGLSETTCYSCFLPVDLAPKSHKNWMQKYGYPSIGAAIPANDMDIQDSDGNSLQAGERGEIVIRGVNVMKEYYNNPGANEKAFTNGWFRSGDEGFFLMDEETDQRFFFITGRLKEIIIRGGVNLAPLEIDEVINKAPGVKAGIAVGFENDWYGEEVGAYVQRVDDSADEKAILEYCQQHLPFSKAPKVVVFGDDIPVTSTGKYQRRKVAHHFEGWKATQFRKTS